MASQPDEVTTKTEPWDGARGPIKQVYKDVMKQYNKGNPKVWGEGKNQDYIADQSNATVDAQKEIRKIAGQDPKYIDNARQAIGQISAGNAFGEKDDNVLRQMMNGVDIGNDPSANKIDKISDGAWNNSDPGKQTVNQAQNFTMAGQNKTENLYCQLGDLANNTNAATGQAANLNQYQNAGMNLQQQQAQQLSNASNPAMAYLQQTASGANVMGDPTLTARMQASDEEIFNNYNNIIKPQQNSQASLAGRTGSGAAQMIANQGTTQAMTAAANARNNMMSDVYKTGTANQMNAANQIGNMYNSDVSNAMQANNNLAGTSNSQQNTRISGINTYGDLNNANQANSLAAMQQQLATAGQMGDMSLAQSQQRLAAANANNAQYNADRGYQMQALGMQQDQYNQGIQNQLANNASMMNAANSFSQNQNADAQTRLQASGMAGDQRALDYYDAQQLAGVGSQMDARKTAELQARMAEFDAKQNKGMNNASNVLSLLQGGGYNNTTQPVQNNTTGQVLGGLTSLLGLFAMSDENTKIVFEYVGESVTGLPLYRWAYKQKPEKVFVGPMAQDVEKWKPEAVIEIDGVKLIDVGVTLEGAI